MFGMSGCAWVRSSIALWHRLPTAPCLMLLQGGDGSEALSCLLLLQVQLEGRWENAWQCQVLFLDDSNRVRQLQVGARARAALQAPLLSSFCLPIC